VDSNCDGKHHSHHHSTVLNKTSSTNSKSEVVDWLKVRNITADPTKTNVELLQCVELLKACKIYELDRSIINGIIRLYSYTIPLPV
jgi:hypothetical protein